MNHLRAVCRTSGCTGGDVQCQARLRLECALQRFYKFTGFRPGQLEAMLLLLHCKDVFVRMATGSSKSICMFLLPLAVNYSCMAYYPCLYAFCTPSLLPFQFFVIYL